ncbi:MAG TPA: TerC/Alx family metal homeostasis membrane protein, partial [Polyangiaceae bacterium]
VEKSLSVDNLFVFLVIFKSLKIPNEEQHRVLQWGIFGAFVTRGVFIFLGGEILRAWHPVVYVLGAFLIYTGIQTLRSHGQEEEDEGESRTMAFVRRFLPVSKTLHGHHFVTKENGRTLATPLLFALVVIELSDVLFAVDSIPAVFAITLDPFIVYASNIFAVLGLRALYLVLADVLGDLKYLHYGLAGILSFTGAKMLISGFFHIPNAASLIVIAVLLVASIVPSVFARKHAPT